MHNIVYENYNGYVNSCSIANCNCRKLAINLMHSVLYHNMQCRWLKIPVTNSPCTLRPIQQLKMEMPRLPKEWDRELSSNKRKCMFHTHTDSMVQRFVQERSALEFVVDTQPQCSVHGEKKYTIVHNNDHAI